MCIRDSLIAVGLRVLATGSASPSSGGLAKPSGSPPVAPKGSWPLLAPSSPPCPLLLMRFGVCRSSVSREHSSSAQAASFWRK
eukprot:2525842-Alexandrium_andersonii.AAC.1